MPLSEPLDNSLAKKWNGWKKLMYLGGGEGYRHITGIQTCQITNAFFSNYMALSRGIIVNSYQSVIPVKAMVAGVNNITEVV